MSDFIEPKILKGFRDFLPSQELDRAILQEKLSAVFRSFGFVPIDTPVLEFSEILLRKSHGETEKQVFRFNDNGGRDVALRFDLTVPFARFVAAHKAELYFPFKRYHIAKVWRGEKPQAGRYREFVQCDFDAVGADNAAADFEVLQLIKTAFDAIGIERITVKVNHRGVFNRFLEKIELREKTDDVLRVVDKIDKVGGEETKKSLEEICGKGDFRIDEILDFITPKSSFDETLAHIADKAGGESDDTKRLREVFSLLRTAKIEGAFVLDPSITRGLDYYTGIVCETFLNDLPSIGSVCSGGRYDNLAGLYMRDKISGVGASIGLDRLLAALSELKVAAPDAHFVDAEILCLDESLLSHYVLVASELRQLGIRCEVFLTGRKMIQQYEVAESKKIPFAILIGETEAQKGEMSVKNLKTRQEVKNLSLEKAAAFIKSELSLR